MSVANYQIKKDTETVNETIITNIVKMLAYRGWVDEDNIKKISSDLLNLKKEEKIYNIKLKKSLIDVETYEPFENKKDWKNFKSENIIVFIFNQKITGKSQQLTDFINKYNDYHKIIIVESITDKSHQVLTSGKFIEIFSEVEFMINITEHVCCPQFIVLTNEEADECNKSYNVKKKEMQKQYDSDPISRYLFLRRGQVIRIIRNNTLTAQSVSYRIIVHKANANK
jgi:DNA-directed RNA polymerase subunit H (RpoH/RPB5)